MTFLFIVNYLNAVFKTLKCFFILSNKTWPYGTVEDPALRESKTNGYAELISPCYELRVVGYELWKEYRISKCFSLLLRFDIPCSTFDIQNTFLPQPTTRNPQRVAFTMEPLTGVIKAEPFGLGYLLKKYIGLTFPHDYIDVKVIINIL